MTPLAIPGLLLTSLVPGWLLYRSIWPEARVNGPMAFVRTVVASVALSIGITIVVGSALGYAPHGETGLFRPVLLAGLLVAASVGLFLVAARRGAFPRLAGRFARTDARAPTTFVVARR